MHNQFFGGRQGLLEGRPAGTPIMQEQSWVQELVRREGS